MFFSVKSSVKILNKVYTPCICYEVTDVLAPTIDKMVEEGKAYKYENRVFFQNGKVIVKKETDTCTESKSSEKKQKKSKEAPVSESEDIEGF